MEKIHLLVDRFFLAFLVVKVDGKNPSTGRSIFFCYFGLRIKSSSLGHQTRWLCQVIPNQSAPFHSEGQCQDFLSLRWFAKIAAKIFHTNVVFALANQHTGWKFEIVAKNLTLGAFFNLIVQLKLNRSNENKHSHPTGKPICNLYDAWI